MAFYALYNWYSSWSRRGYPDMIAWYRHKLYNDWLDSLSLDERQIVLDRQAKDRKDRLSRLACLFCLSSFLSGRTGSVFKDFD